METIRAGIITGVAAMLFCVSVTIFLEITNRLELSADYLTDTTDLYNNLVREDKYEGGRSIGWSDIGYEELYSNKIYTRERLIAFLMNDRLDCDIRLEKLYLSKENYNLSMLMDICPKLSEKYTAKYHPDERGRVVYIEFEPYYSAS